MLCSKATLRIQVGSNRVRKQEEGAELAVKTLIDRKPLLVSKRELLHSALNRFALELT